VIGFCRFESEEKFFSSTRRRRFYLFPGGVP